MMIEEEVLISHPLQYIGRGYSSSLNFLFIKHERVQFSEIIRKAKKIYFSLFPDVTYYSAKGEERFVFGTGEEIHFRYIDYLDLKEMKLGSLCYYQNIYTDETDMMDLERFKKQCFPKKPKDNYKPTIKTKIYNGITKLLTKETHYSKEECMKKLQDLITSNYWYTIAATGSHLSIKEKHNSFEYGQEGISYVLEADFPQGKIENEFFIGYNAIDNESIAFNFNTMEKLVHIHIDKVKNFMENLEIEQL